MYFCTRGDMPQQHVDNTYTNHFNVEREQVSGVNQIRPPHCADRFNRPFEDYTHSQRYLVGGNTSHFKRTNLPQHNSSYLNANNSRENNSPKMGQKNAKTNNEGIFHLNNDAYNGRYSNLTYNHASDMNPRNYNFNNIKIVEDDENYSSSINPASNISGGKMGSHPNGHVLDHRMFQLKKDDVNPDHARSHQDYARVNRDNWAPGPYHHHMFNNDMGFLTPNRVSNNLETQSPNINMNPGTLHPHQYKHNNQMLEDKYDQLKNKWEPPNSYPYGNTAPPIAPPISSPVGANQKNKADLYDNVGKTNSPPYGTQFNMNALYNNFKKNSSQWKDMNVRPFPNRDNINYEKYEGGGNYHENHIGNQLNPSMFGKHKPSGIDDIIKKYTGKDNQDDNFKFNWGHAKNQVTGGEVFKGANKYINDAHVRNYLPSEDRTGNHANASPNYTPQHNVLYGFSQNGGYLSKAANASNHANAANAANAANPSNGNNVGNVANGGSAPLLYPNCSSLCNKEKDEEEKKREKKINLLKNIIVTNPNPKYNFSFSDDLYESLPAHDNNYLNTSSLADLNHMTNGNHAHQGQNDILGEGLQNRVSAHNNAYEDFNTPEKLNETPGIMNRHHFKSDVVPVDEDFYGERFGGDRFGVDRFGGDRFGVEKYGVDKQPQDMRRNDENSRYQQHNAEREVAQNPFPRLEPNRNSIHALRDRDKNSIKLYDDNFKHRGGTPRGAFTNNTRLHTMTDLHHNQENKPPPLIDLVENRTSNYLGEKTFGRQIDQLDYLKKFENNTHHGSENVFRPSEGGGRNESDIRYRVATQHGGDAFSNINSMNIFKTHAKSGDNYEEGSLFNKNPINEATKQTNRYLQEDVTKPSNNLFNMENIFQSDKRNGLLNEINKSPFVRNEGPSHMHMLDRDRNAQLDGSTRQNKNLTYKDDKDFIRRPYCDKSARTLFEPYDDPTLRTRQYALSGNNRDVFREGDNMRNHTEHRREDEHVGAICINKNDNDNLFPKSNFQFLSEKKNYTNFGEANCPTGKVPIRDEPTKEPINNNSHYNPQRMLSKPTNLLHTNYHSTLKTNTMNDHPTSVTSNQHWIGGGLHNFTKQQNETSITTKYNHFTRTKSYMDLQNEQDENKMNENILKPINHPPWKYESTPNVMVPTSNVNFSTNFNQVGNDTEGANLMTLFNNDSKKNMQSGNRDCESGVFNAGGNWGGNHNNVGTTGAKAFLGILNEQQNRYSNLLNTMGRYTPRDALGRDGNNPLPNYTNKKPFNPSGAHNFSFAKQPLHKQLPPLPFKPLGKQPNAEGMGQTKLKALEAVGRPKLGEGVNNQLSSNNHVSSNHLGRFNHGHVPNQPHNTPSGNGNLLKNSIAPFREKNAYLGGLAELTPFERYGDGKDLLHRRSELFHHTNEPKECTLKSGNVKFNSYLSSYPDQIYFPNEKNAQDSVAHRSGMNRYSLGDAADGYMGGELLSGKLLGGNPFLNREKEDASNDKYAHEKYPNETYASRENLNLSLLPTEGDRPIRNFAYNKDRHISLSNNISMLLERISNNSDKKTCMNDFVMKNKSSDISNLCVNTVNYNDNLTIDTQQFVISDHHVCNFGLWKLYRCKLRHDKASFLVSIVDSFYLNRGDSNDTVANNILFHKRLRHMNILSYEGKTADKNKLYLLFEHVHGNVLKSQSAPLEENIIASYAYQIVDLLEYMHANFIFFHGLLSNIIILQKNTREELLQILHERKKNVNKYFDVYKHGIVKVFNFDFANMDATEKDYQFDFLCLAVLIYEMCTKYNTYYSSKFEDITERIYNTDFFFPHFVSFELKNFCYELCSKRRHCFSDLKNHAWFQKNLNF
ncbi:serine/threonine protein kinase [Plasmodium fragile]|uniref:Serine/threonine protein kinase n=1 Tax=Plasmodium fragile TaxID=5857 RepID=A0A0D9QLA0_PLAFR|nr:serine/threonine protein kinase [Plasmodium fragile]KJP87840.1 serine/threonine protein kinase [Plasmodium fragile]